MNASGRWISKRHWSLGLIALSIAVIVFVLLFLPRLERYFLIQEGRDQSATLRLAVEGLRTNLERYAPIPGLIAARPEVRAVIENPNNRLIRSDAQQLLSDTAVALRASGVYLEDKNGVPLIAVPAVAANSSQGEFSYRPYFSRAVAGGLGQYYALGTQSGERGFFYASPVRIDGRIEGVVAVKFAVDQFEAAWRDGRTEIIVRDANDIVFMSSKPSWNFRAMSELSNARRALIAEAKQFPIDQLMPLPNEFTPLAEGLSLAEIEDDGAVESYISSTSLIARAGWRVTVLTPTTDAFALARTLAISLLLSCLLVAMLFFAFWQRRQRLSERIQAQHQAQLILERRVDERTAELNKTNAKLVDEIEERKATESVLRKTQAELVQTGKLAALGQMSAALSHELNQPLAAMKAYAENAVAFLDRGMGDQARDNVRQISTLSDRMSAIAKHLRNFARRPQDKTKRVNLTAVVDDALALMQPKISAAGATIDFVRPSHAPFVVGGPVRLQQVVVNLISNALDAMQSNGEPRVKIEIIALSTESKIIVRDYGAGLSEEALTLLFDPFFTTKDPGQGLGLGLSISYNIVRDFGGNISASNHDGGGAEFVVTLKNAERSIEAAQ